MRLNREKNIHHYELMRILFGTIEHFYAHWKNGKMMKNHAENVHIGRAGKIHSPNFKGVQNPL